MGKLHARVYSQMPQVRLVGVYDANLDAAQATVAEFGGEAFDDLDKLAQRVGAVTIAVPTNAHARSEEHTSESSHMSISYAVFCLTCDWIYTLSLHDALPISPSSPSASAR